MMGGQVSLNPEELEAKLHSQAINKELCQGIKSESVKILVLGADASGKSTLIKQMKIIYGDGYTVRELKGYKTMVHNNLLYTMKAIIKAMDRLKIPLGDSSNEVHTSAILKISSPLELGAVIPPEIADSLKLIMYDTGFQESFHRGYEYELSDYAYYFIREIECILEPLYIPNVEDFLHIFTRTTGIIETSFKIDGIVYRIFDVGGTRSERRKWIHCFDDVGAVLFVASLDGYDMTLWEESSANRLEEALNLFQAICNNKFLKKSLLILILNKMDLFKEKITRSVRHLRLFFPEYTGPDHDAETASKYILEQFQVRNMVKDKIVYHHFITATDTNNVQLVFKAVFDAIIHDNLLTAVLL